MEYLQAVVLGGSLLLSGVAAYIILNKEFARYTYEEDDKKEVSGE